MRPQAGDGDRNGAWPHGKAAEDQRGAALAEVSPGHQMGRAARSPKASQRTAAVARRLSVVALSRSVLTRRFPPGVGQQPI